MTVISFVLAGCTPPFEERFEGDLSIAADLDLGSVGHVALIAPHGGGFTPTSLDYFVEGEDVTERLESTLSEAGFIESRPVEGLWRQWQRDSDGLLQTMQIESFAEGDEFTSGAGKDAKTYVAGDKASGSL